MTPIDQKAVARILDQIHYDFIEGPAQAKALARRVGELAALGGNLGIDTETTGLDPRKHQVRLIQVGSVDFALVVDLNGWRTEGKRQVDWSRPGLRELKDLLESKQPKVLQNAAFDIPFLRGEGVNLSGYIFDTMIAAKIINNGMGAKNDLGSIAHRELGLPLEKQLQKSDWSGELTIEQVKYSARDAVCLPWIRTSLLAKLKAAKFVPSVSLNDVFQLEMKALRPITMMQWHGFGFDVVKAHALKLSLQQRAGELKLAFLEALDEAIKARFPTELDVWLPRNADGSYNTNEKEVGSIRLGTKVYAGFNPRSVQQMATRFEQAGIILPKDKAGKPVMDQNLLAFLRADFKLIREYLDWKEVATRGSAVETLIKSVGGDGRIHASYRQLGAETGRLSCVGPNLQQVPRAREFRELFVADEGNVLVVADFSQVELRVAAELSGEPRMLEAYLAGRDLHTETAALMRGVPLDQVTKADRTSAKVANFGLLYGAGPATLRKQAVSQYGIDMTIGEAREIVENFRRAYPRLYDYQRGVGEATTACIYTKYGRRRIVIGTFNDKFTVRNNTPVQGTAGDIAKIAMAKLWEYLVQAQPGEARLIAMVHDEIVLEVRAGVKDRWSQTVVSCMVSAGALVCQRVPIVAEVSSGTTWADAK
jgi:hypothetical protein